MSFDPNQPIADRISIIENALILPFAEGQSRRLRRPAGVYDAEGTYLPLGQCLRNTRTPTTVRPPEPPPEAEGATLKGTWLYGGMLYQHFGHFLVESTARLWALGHTPEPLNGVIFLPKKQVSWPKRFVKPMLPLLGLTGEAAKSSIATSTPLRVERLVLGPQGFGTGDMMGGSPEYRAYMQQNFGRDIAPEGAENIYISRTKLFSKRGRYFAETRIEALFTAAGYRIYHPQEEPIEAQIAQYKAARRIVSSDSSALHLAAYFTRPDDRIAIILRRPGNTIDDFLMQFEHFSGNRPTVIDALNGRLYQFEGAKLAQMSEIYSELDFDALGRQLRDAGFIASTDGWQDPTRDEIDRERALLSERLGLRIEPVTT